MIEIKTSRELVDYDTALAFMENRVEQILAGSAQPLLWFLQHPPLLTAGTSAKEEDLLDKDALPIYQAGRGGQYTYHGPGQMVVYIMMDLREQGRDIRKFVQMLEQWLIDSLKTFGIHAYKHPEHIGIWVRGNETCEEKIAAIGIRVRKWITFHGIALNIHPDLSHFDTIIPCGIHNTAQQTFGVTSFEKLAVSYDWDVIEQQLVKKFKDIFFRNHRSS